MRQSVSAWGRLDNAVHEVQTLFDRTALPREIEAGGAGGPGAPGATGVAGVTGVTGVTTGLAHGMGRSYGDVCLNPGGRLWRTTGLNRYIAFDEHNGRLRCEAGVLLRDIQRLMLPRGWRLPVTPGTQLITVGGAIANDVHGKNHHRYGCFGHHVLALQLARTDGRIIECGPQHPHHADWFAATVGGLGLTGVIVTAELQLVRAAGPWLATETLAYSSLAQFFALADASDASDASGTSDTAWEHSVAWLDTSAGGAARGLFMRGRPLSHDASPPLSPQQPPHSQAHRRMPWTPPFSLVNRLSLRAFNALYFHAKKRGPAVLHHEAFLYPLDDVQDWNRLYGPKGFFQYQCVVPRATAQDTVPELLRAVSASHQGSFLNVLKTFGDRASVGMLSFARPGVTLAIDFPNLGAATLQLLARLDTIVAVAGGCLYPAKDARMPRALFEQGFPRFAEFARYRDAGISSGMSRRLLGS